MAAILAISACPALPAYAEGGSGGSTPPDKPAGESGDASGGHGGGSGDLGSGGSGGGQMGGSGGGGGGADTMSFDYSGSYSGVLTADGQEAAYEGESVSATQSDQNAALAQNGGTLTLSGGSLTKSGDDSDGDRCNFYGVNSIVLSVGEASKAILEGTSLTALSEGSNGIFATDSATAYAKDVTISTTADNSRALDATYSGTIVAGSIDADTAGDHCATIATDRGGGSVSVVDSELSTAGSGSPLLYSTGDIEVSGVTGTATGSQIAGMEGLNTILINDSTLTSTVTGATASDPVANGVIIYQSTSGDAESSTGEAATFQACDSTLSSAIESGSMFYLTNTSADVVLCRTTLDFDSGSATLLKAEGNDSNNWGSAGSNGASVKVTGIEQTLTGAITADSISSVDLHLTQGSEWTGAASASEASAASTVSVSVDSTSTWAVAGSCSIASLSVEEGAQIVDSLGNDVTIVSGGQTVVSGSSDVVVTVEGDYSSAYDSSQASSLSTDLIDRSGYDEQFGTSTEWAMGDAQASVFAKSFAVFFRQLAAIM